MTRSGLATLCLALGGGVLLRVTLTTPATAQERQSFRHVSVEQGLSHGAVRDILQDRQGFIWIATEDGLNRYDGVNLKVFRHCRIDRKGEDYILTDLDSSNGSVVNGERASKTILKQGDYVRLGYTIISFQMVDQLEPA